MARDMSTDVLPYTRCISSVHLGMKCEWFQVWRRRDMRIYVLQRLDMELVLPMRLIQLSYRRRNARTITQALDPQGAAFRFSKVSGVLSIAY